MLVVPSTKKAQPPLVKPQPSSVKPPVKKESKRSVVISDSDDDSDSDSSDLSPLPLKWSSEKSDDDDKIVVPKKMESKSIRSHSDKLIHKEKYTTSSTMGKVPKKNIAEFKAKTKAEGEFGKLLVETEQAELREIKKDIEEIKRSNPLYSRISKALFEDERNVMLNGPGGTGKTYLLKKLADEARLRGLKVGLSATTGSASSSIKGVTFHSLMGIGLADKPLKYIIKKIKGKMIERELKEYDFIFTDEVSMLGASVFQVANEVLKTIRKDDRPFGGIRFVSSNDFLQLKPVNDEFVFENAAWDLFNFRVFNFTIPYRFPDMNHFNMLKNIRYGIVNTVINKILQSRVEAYNHYIKTGVFGLFDMLNQLKKCVKVTKFPAELDTIVSDYALENQKIVPTILYCKKVDVNKINLQKLAELPSPQVTFTANDEFKCKNPKLEGTEEEERYRKMYKKTMDDSVPEQVFLKKGAQVMLTKNLNVKEGLVNGSRGVVEEIKQEMGIVTVFVRFMNGMVMTLGKMETEMSNKKFSYKRMQIPLILAWAITIHKAQGCSLDCAIMDLGSSIFEEALPYVALSRVRTLFGILLKAYDARKLRANEKALEYEYLLIQKSKEEDALEDD